MIDETDPTFLFLEKFITDAMNRGIIPMHVAADLSQYLGVEWFENQNVPVLPGDPGPYIQLFTPSTTYKDPPHTQFSSLNDD